MRALDSPLFRQTSPAAVSSRMPLHQASHHPRPGRLPYDDHPSNLGSLPNFLPNQQQQLPVLTAGTGYASTLATIATAAGTSSSSSSLGYVISFFLGGLFFSSLVAITSAVYAFGMDNVRYLLRLIWVVTKLVWNSFREALVAAKEVLLDEDEIDEKIEDDLTTTTTNTTITLDEKAVPRKRRRFSFGRRRREQPKKKKQWREAWQVLQTELRKTRQAAAEGVAALKQEASLYAGAVGAPGLIPLQYVVDRFLPFGIAGALEKSLLENLQEVSRQTASLKRIQLTNLNIGTTAPRFESARIYELGQDAVAFDAEVDWAAKDLDIQLTAVTVIFAKIPIRISQLQFKGVVRVILTPLMKEAPGYGAALVSFPKAPSINFNVRVAGGDITRIPWLRTELIAALQKNVAQSFLWPRRIVVPMENPETGRPLLRTPTLQVLETTDPLWKREQFLAESRPILERDQDDLKDLKQQFKVFVNPKNDTATITDNDDMDTIDVVPSSKHFDTVQNGVVLKALTTVLQKTG